MIMQDIHNPYQPLTGGFISSGSPLVSQYQYSTGLYRNQHPNAYGAVSMGYTNMGKFGDRAKEIGSRIRDVITRPREDHKDEASAQDRQTIRELAGKSRECLDMLSQIDGQDYSTWNIEAMRACANAIKAGYKFKQENQQDIDILLGKNNQQMKPLSTTPQRVPKPLSSQLPSSLPPSNLDFEVDYMENDGLSDGTKIVVGVGIAAGLYFVGKHFKLI